MSNVKELVVVSVDKVIDAATEKRYAIVTLKQIAGVSAATGAIKYQMEKGQPLVATRLANLSVNDTTSLNVGDIIDGQIVKVKTTDYQIEGRTVNTFTQAVYDGESAFDLVNAALERRGHIACALKADGTPTLDLSTLGPKPINQEDAVGAGAGAGDDAGEGAE